MTTETKILTDGQIESIAQQYTMTAPDGNVVTTGPWRFARAIEQAVLQSPEIQALRKDAARYRWLKANIQEDYGLPGAYYLPDDDTETWDRTIDAAMEKQP